MNHAIVDKNGEVVNVVWWLGDEWLPPRGHMVIRSDVMGIGDMYDHEKGHVTKPDGRKFHRDTKYDDYVKGEAHLKD